MKFYYLVLDWGRVSFDCSDAFDSHSAFVNAGSCPHSNFALRAKARHAFERFTKVECELKASEQTKGRIFPWGGARFDLTQGNSSTVGELDLFDKAEYYGFMKLALTTLLLLFNFVLQSSVADFQAINDHAAEIKSPANISVQILEVKSKFVSKKISDMIFFCFKFSFQKTKSVLSWIKIHSYSIRFKKIYMFFCVYLL